MHPELILDTWYCSSNYDLTLKLWRHYLYGVKLTVCPDHKSLKYLIDQKEVEYEITKIDGLLKDFGHEILYHLGKADVIIDALN